MELSGGQINNERYQSQFKNSDSESIVSWNGIFYLIQNNIIHKTFNEALNFRWNCTTNDCNEKRKNSQNEN